MSGTMTSERTEAEGLLTPPRDEAIATRKHLARTRLGGDVVRTAGPGERRSLATRRYAQRTRRRTWLLYAVLAALALFPPMWAVYLVAWLVWRSRPKQRSMRGVRQAVRAIEKDQPGVALRQLQEAHYLDPSNPDALYWLGLLLSRQGRHEEAAEALSIVAERVPGLPEVEGALVDAYVAADAPADAVYHAQRLLDVAPYAPETLLKLADAFEADGRPDLAIEALRQAPLHKRTLPPPLLAVHYRLGALYEAAGEPERALEHFTRVYARDAAFRDVRARMAALEGER